MAIVRNIQNNQLYRYLGDNKYKNLMTGVSGEIAAELAQKIFKINLEMTRLCNEYPLLEEAIEKLNLKMDKTALAPDTQ